MVVESPKILINYEALIVIFKAAVYSDEISNDILSNINSSAIFWT
jgi:hypothetical protein